MTLREILHAHVPALTQLSTVRDAVDRMDVYQFPALVVLDENRKPIAVVTEGDLARAAVMHDGVLGIAQQSVLQFSSSDPTTAGPGMEVADALHEMLSRGLTVLPVVEDQLFLGMVLRVDLMQAMLMDVIPAE